MKPTFIRPLSIDLARYRRRAVASLYSSLVTRPTGRAVRMGVESQIAELPLDAPLHVLVLDFSQVRVLDFSCADEIVAKLLQKHVSQGPPAPPLYFLARGVNESHAEAIEAVLERHGLLLSVETIDGRRKLLGAVPAALKRCWDTVVRRGRLRPADAGTELGLGPPLLSEHFDSLAAHRLVVRWEDGSVSALFTLEDPTSE